MVRVKCVNQIILLKIKKDWQLFQAARSLSIRVFGSFCRQSGNSKCSTNIGSKHANKLQPVPSLAFFLITSTFESLYETFPPPEPAVRPVHACWPHEVFGLPLICYRQPRL
jgi:hypothetical protein